MRHFIIAIAAIGWGSWQIRPDLMFFVDILKITVFVALILFGIVAVLAGIKQFKTND